jgi:hypothetical protein
MVLVYSLSKLVDQEGEDRSMDPLRGSETSSLGTVSPDIPILLARQPLT